MTLEREGIIAEWRAKLEAAQSDYRVASARALIAQGERDMLSNSDGHFAFKRANIIEAAALQKYRDTLRIFVDVAVDGKRPPDETR